jgi:AmmeMemoRadiSam system protein A
MSFLSELDRSAILRLASMAAVDAVSGGKLPEQIPHEGIFAERQGVFVTLRAGRRLRGCIGVIQPEEPLGDSIVRCAISAALHDPRFPPTRLDELDELQIEISLLSPMAPIKLQEIEIGRHGLLVCCGGRRGLLLPQVASEHHLSAHEFLEEACRKAELPRDAWLDPDTEVFGFTCEVFSDAIHLVDSQAPHKPKPAWPDSNLGK